ncbi:hypothetical protein PORY_001593 [Pneumocystis oryctolagi]|uniref:Uncharacterized protein n=1 Tax=Pneumocystis oryctolagi TaxID=42067 RepID=A0ACB7CBH4_9ASCO|nr:hypothetical protein PORY_001593 [Pneumocystis oryctolagi]
MYTFRKRLHIHNMQYLALLSSVTSLYDPKSRVQLVNQKKLEEIIKTSKHLSVVKFFAPWCGYCKQFAPAYSTFAEKVSDFINAVDCDDQANALLCSTYEVKGFPTVKLLIPSKNGLKVEDFQGQRTFNGLMDASVSKIPHFIEKIEDNITSFLNKHKKKAKLLLFTTKKTLNGFFKTLSVDFQDHIVFASIHESYKEAAEVFTISTFPTIVFIPGEGEDPVVYSADEMNYKSIRSFLEKYVPIEEIKSEKIPDQAKENKNSILEELQTIDEFIENVIGISSSVSDFDFFNKISKKHKKFRYFYVNSTKEIVNTMSEALEITLDEPKIILVNGKKNWYIEIIGHSTVDQLLELISKITLGDKIEKKKLSKKIIDMVPKIKNKEL